MQSRCNGPRKTLWALSSQAPAQWTEIQGSAQLYPELAAIGGRSSYLPRKILVPSEHKPDCIDRLSWHEFAGRLLFYGRSRCSIVRRKIERLPLLCGRQRGLPRWRDRTTPEETTGVVAMAPRPVVWMV